MAATASHWGAVGAWLSVAHIPPCPSLAPPTVAVPSLEFARRPTPAAHRPLPPRRPPKVSSSISRIVPHFHTTFPFIRSCTPPSSFQVCLDQISQSSFSKSHHLPVPVYIAGPRTYPCPLLSGIPAETLDSSRHSTHLLFSASFFLHASVPRYNPLRPQLSRAFTCGLRLGTFCCPLIDPAKSAVKCSLQATRVPRKRHHNPVVFQCALLREANCQL